VLIPVHPYVSGCCYCCCEEEEDAEDGATSKAMVMVHKPFCTTHMEREMQQSKQKRLQRRRGDLYSAPLTPKKERKSQE